MSSLNQLDLGMFDTKTAPEPEPVKDSGKPDYVVRFSKTRAGYDVLVCTADPVPDDVLAEGERHSVPVFSGREILTMRDCDPELVSHVLSIKRKFPGTSVQKITRGGCQ